jgi:hypothetical protein
MTMAGGAPVAPAYRVVRTAVSPERGSRSLGHAFTFPRYRLGLPAATPIVPVFVNTYYPPNVPSTAWCYALGRAVRRAAEKAYS